VLVSLSRVGAPTSQPVTLAEAKAHLRVDGAADDGLIGLYLEAAVDAVEAATGRCLTQQDWEMQLSDFPASDHPIEPAHAPLLSVVSLRTVSALGIVTTLAEGAYQVVAPAGPYALRGQVRPAPGTLWPMTDSDVLGPVRLTYRAGYAQVPAGLRSAVLLLVGDSYANREAASVARLQEQPALRRLLAPFSLFWGA
jgi:uncharacterized phiE125 gp8 family phage protein